MEENRYLYINPQKCERLLSTFGKKVLCELMKQHDKERNKTNVHSKRRHCSPTKKILNFNNDSLRGSPSIPSTMPKPVEIFNTETSVNLNLMEETVSEILTSVELTKTLHIPNEFVHPTIVSRNVVYDALDSVDPSKTTSSKESNNKTNNGVGTKRNDVNWDNMFDSELFGDVTANAIDVEVNGKPNMPDAMFQREHNNQITKTGFNEKRFQKCDKKRNSFGGVTENAIDRDVYSEPNIPDAIFLREHNKQMNKTDFNEKSFQNCDKMRKLFGDVTENEDYGETNMSDVIILKQHSKDIIKTDINEESYKNCNKKRKTTDAVSTRNIKKAKHQNETIEKSNETNKVKPKNNFRKQKYTKTVKKWLNDVELHNPINENIVAENCEKIKTNETDANKQDTGPNKAFDYNKPKLIIDKSLKTNKKVIQAQLANKDGIMKFSKPKTEAMETGKEIADSKEVKDKKIKVPKKFVPPLKSQIPVKDIAYEIITVDDINIQNYINETNFIGESELMAVLIYSNGFCQLNSQFTDGTCVADGLLLSTGDVFYYFKGSNQSIKKVLIRIFKENTVISYEARSVLIYFASHLQMDIYNINMYDAKIGASLLDPDNPPENFSDLQKLLSFTAPYTIATECPQQKASWYTSLLRECWVKLKEMLVDNQLWHVFVEIEMKLLPIISGIRNQSRFFILVSVEMECRGVSIDLSKLKSLEALLVARMQQIEQKCYKAAGKVFQINSTVQVRSILYDELKLDSKCNIKIRETLSGGLKSTSETMLRSLMSVHELPKLVLEYRHLHKAHATFLAGIAQHVNDNVVRPTWLQTAAATGRIASSNPNLQAIPKVPFNLVMFPEGDDTANVELKFRSLYVSRAGYSLLAADFKHIECRVFAHLAADSALAGALAHDHDLFTVLAALWLNKPEDTVTPAERERTKRLVYASLYGAGTRKLMEILDVSYEQALQVAASFNRTFPSLKSFGRQVVSKCCQSGARLSTLCGRVRHFTNITSTDFNLRSHAERQAVNFVVQGSAADLCKRAMILTEEQLRGCSPPVEAHLLLQIHDELVWEVKQEHVATAAGIIKRVMEGCGSQCGMSALLPVAITVGDNWGDMGHYHLPN